MRLVPSLRRAGLLLSVVSLAAAAQEHLPTAASLDAAKRSKVAAAQLAPRVQKLSEQCEAFDEAAEKAGLKMEGTRYQLDPSQPPARQAIDALNGKLKALASLAAMVKTECQKWRSLTQDIDVGSGVEAERVACEGWYASVGKRADCSAWRQLESKFWPGDGTCADPVERADEIAEEWKRFETQDLEPARATAAHARALDELYLQPVSGNARERAIALPRKFVLEIRDAGRAVIDTAALFAAAHPSRFVFLRKDVSGLPRDSLQDQPGSLSRKLKKGEAVLSLRRGTISSREVEILSLDGNTGIVSLEDLAQVPLPGTRPAPLTATDLDVFDNRGNTLAGPRWYEPDNTGFSLDEPNAWLDLLDPQEPRATQFLEAKEKVLGCYQKQRSKLDPSGTLSKYYDIVTFGRNGDIKKVEPAAVKFDRAACAACGCKKFNDLKASYIKAAIAPAQKKAFERYKPVVEQLTKTNFAAAASGAPRGVDDWQGKAL